MDILLHNGAVGFEFRERRHRQGMKLAAHAVDVCEGEGARVCAIGQQDKGAPAVGIVPATRAGKAQVPETVGRQARARGRVFRLGQLPAERASLLHGFRHVGLKERAGFGLK